MKSGICKFVNIPNCWTSKYIVTKLNLIPETAKTNLKFVLLEKSGT